ISWAHGAALVPVLVACGLAMAIRRRMGPSARPIPALVPAAAVVGLVATASLVIAWSHLCVTAAIAAGTTWPSLARGMPQGLFLAMAFSVLFHVYSAITFTGHIAFGVAGALRGRRGRVPYGAPLPAGEPEILTLAHALGAHHLSLGHE